MNIELETYFNKVFYSLYLNGEVLFLAQMNLHSLINEEFISDSLSIDDMSDSAHTYFLDLYQHDICHNLILYWFNGS